MSGYDPARYGHVVGDYDRLYPGEPSDNAAAVRFLSRLALERAERSVVEFGIGSGRLALGLRAFGVEVAGIDGSDEMIARLRAKPGGDDVPVVLGDYRDAQVPGAFSVALLSINGIFDPRGVDAQLDIFRNARRHLAPDGVFVVESWVMSDSQRNGDWSVVPRFVGTEHVEFQLARFDIDTNSIERTLVHLRSAGSEFVTVTDTYASPSELDLMAHVCEFDRLERYSSWDRAQFTATSSRCISVYRRRPVQPSEC